MFYGYLAGWWWGVCCQPAKRVPVFAAPDRLKVSVGMYKKKKNTHYIISSCNWRAIYKVIECKMSAKCWIEETKRKAITPNF